ELRHVADETRDVVRRIHALTGCGPELRLPAAVGEQRSQGGRESGSVTGGHQDPGRPVVHHIGDTTNGGGHHRLAGGHRLDDAHGRSLVARRERDNICRRVDNRDVALPAEEPATLPEAEAGALSFEGLPQLTITDDEREGG